MLGDIGSSFSYVLGGYYFEEKFAEDSVQTALALIPGRTLPYHLTGPRAALAYRGTNEAWAVYANGTYTLPIWGERLSFSGGLRQTEDTRSYFRSPTNQASKKFDDLNFDASVNYKATEDFFVYARVASGFNAGGYNMRDTAVPAIPFDPEELTAYEVGIKTDWLDQRLRLNAAAFFSDYSSIQTSVVLATATPGIVSNSTINGAAAEIKGVELELLA